VYGNRFHASNIHPTAGIGGAKVDDHVDAEEHIEKKVKDLHGG